MLGQYVIQTIKNSNICRFFCTHKHRGPKSDVSGSFCGENFYYVSPRKLQAALTSMWRSSRCLRLPLMLLPLHSLALTSYHLLNTSPILLSPFSFNEDHPPLVLPFPLNLPFIQPPPLPLLTSYVAPNSIFLSISGPLSFILPLLSSCRPPASPGPGCLSSVFARCICRLFLRGASCVCSPPYCVI